MGLSVMPCADYSSKPGKLVLKLESKFSNDTESSRPLTVICFSPGWFNISHSHEVAFYQFSVVPAAMNFSSESPPRRKMLLESKCLTRATCIFRTGSSDDMLANPENPPSVVIEGVPHVREFLGFPRVFFFARI